MAGASAFPWLPRGEGTARAACAMMRQPSDAGVIAKLRTSESLTSGNGPWILAATILGSSMVFIDGTVVNVVLPVLQSDLHATAIDLQWIVVGYTLFLSSLMLVGGSLGDHYGRRRIFEIGVVVFTAASVWCGLAQSPATLVGARCLQGVGSALLTPASLAIIGANFADADRGKAIGTWSSITAVTSAIGPVLGGWLAQYASWRWVFFINVPLALAVLAIAAWRVPESHDDEPHHHVDWLGATLCTFGLGGATYALTFSSTLGWTSLSVIAGLLGGLLALALFVVVEARARAPLLPLNLFESRSFAGINVMTLFLYGALSGALFFVPFDLIQVQGYSPTAAGLTMLPLIALVFLLSPVSGGLMVRVGARPLLIVGSLVAGAGYVLFSIPGVGGSYWTTFFLPAIALGLGMSIAVAPLTTTVMESVKPAQVGVASGVNNAASRLAGLIAIAAFGYVVVTMFSHRLETRLDEIRPPARVYAAIWSGRYALAGAPIPSDVDATLRNRLHGAIVDSYVDAFRAVMLMSAGLCLLSAATAAGTVRPRPN